MASNDHYFKLMCNYAALTLRSSLSSIASLVTFGSGTQSNLLQTNNNDIKFSDNKSEVIKSFKMSDFQNIFIGSNASYSKKDSVSNEFKTQYLIAILLVASSAEQLIRGEYKDYVGSSKVICIPSFMFPEREGCVESFFTQFLKTLSNKLPTNSIIVYFDALQLSPSHNLLSLFKKYVLDRGFLPKIAIDSIKLSDMIEILEKRKLFMLVIVDNAESLYTSQYKESIEIVQQLTFIADTATGVISSIVISRSSSISRLLAKNAVSDLENEFPLVKQPEMPNFNLSKMPSHNIYRRVKNMTEFSELVEVLFGLKLTEEILNNLFFLTFGNIFVLKQFARSNFDYNEIVSKLTRSELNLVNKINRHLLIINTNQKIGFDKRVVRLAGKNWVDNIIPVTQNQFTSILSELQLKFTKRDVERLFDLGYINGCLEPVELYSTPLFCGFRPSKIKSLIDKVVCNINKIKNEKSTFVINNKV